MMRGELTGEPKRLTPDFRVREKGEVAVVAVVVVDVEVGV
jgi:hypothetical protein